MAKINIYGELSNVTTEGIIVDSVQVKGGYKVVENGSAREALLNDQKTKGVLVYQADNDTFWRSTGSGWQQVTVPNVITTTPGTYRSVKVDTQGRVTEGSNPTIAITEGGTGATTAAGVLTNLGITATAAELNKLDGVTATAAELSYVSGVTSKIQTQLNNKAPLASPSLTGTPTAPTPAVGTNTTQIATTAFVKTEINTVLAASDAMIFKGTLGTGGTITTLPASHSTGDTYKVITAGTYAGQSCEVGDMIICITNGTTDNNDHWTIVQTNSDGHVTGPTTATANHVAVFKDATGKLIKDSGFTIAASVPANAKFTDTNGYHTSGSWSGLTYTATSKGGAEELKFTLPTGTTSTSVAAGNHTHTTTIATSSAANEITLEHGTKYAITAGGDTFVFTTPPALVWESF